MRAIRSEHVFLVSCHGDLVLHVRRQCIIRRCLYLFHSSLRGDPCHWPQDSCEGDFLSVPLPVLSTCISISKGCRKVARNGLSMAKDSKVKRCPACTCCFKRTSDKVRSRYCTTSTCNTVDVTGSHLSNIACVTYCSTCVKLQLRWSHPRCGPVWKTNLVEVLLELW